MIDTHTHILPGLDDGARDLEEALAMARLAEEDGVRTVVATPHTLNGAYDNWRDGILSACGALNQALREEGVSVHVAPGSEVHVTPEMFEALDEGRLCTCNDKGKYLLVELPMQVVPQLAGNVVRELRSRGITPVLAHPERNATIQRRPGLLADLVAAGAWSQVTAESVTGGFGRSVAKLSRRFLREGLLHVLGSDGHWEDSRRPLVRAGAERLAKWAGRDELSRMEERAWSLME